MPPPIEVSFGATRRYVDLALMEIRDLQTTYDQDRQVAPHQMAAARKKLLEARELLKQIKEP